MGTTKKVKKEAQVTKFILNDKKENGLEVIFDEDVTCEICSSQGVYVVKGEEDTVYICAPCIKGLAKIIKE